MHILHQITIKLFFFFAMFNISSKNNSLNYASIKIWSYGKIVAIVCYIKQMDNQVNGHRYCHFIFFCKLCYGNHSLTLQC